MQHEGGPDLAGAWGLRSEARGYTGPLGRGEGPDEGAGRGVIPVPQPSAECRSPSKDPRRTSVTQLIAFRYYCSRN